MGLEPMKTLHPENLGEDTVIKSLKNLLSDLASAAKTCIIYHLRHNKLP